MTGIAVPPNASTVVLVDDDPLSLALLRHLVVGMPGTSVVTFGLPTDALDLVSGQRSGSRDHRSADAGDDRHRARASAPREPLLREVPILMVTTVQDPETRREALLHGGERLHRQAARRGGGGGPDPEHAGAPARRSRDWRGMRPAWRRTSAGRPRDHPAGARGDRPPGPRGGVPGLGDRSAHHPGGLVRAARGPRARAAGGGAGHALPRRADARRRKDRRARLHPAQAERARRSRVQDHEGAHGDRPSHPRRQRVGPAADGRVDRAHPPRALSTGRDIRAG